MMGWGDHFTKEFPSCEEINKFFKNNPTLVVLTNPFPTQKQLNYHKYLHGASSSTK